MWTGGEGGQKSIKMFGRPKTLTIRRKRKKKAVAKHFALHAYAKNDFDRRLNVFSFVFTISCQRRVQKPVKYLRWSVLRKKVVTALNSSNIPAFFEDLKTIIAYSLP